MIRLDKNKDFFQFMEEVKEEFANDKIIKDLQEKCLVHDFTGSLPEIVGHFKVFHDAATTLIAIASKKVQNINSDAIARFMGDGTKGSKFNMYVQNLNHGLTFYSNEDKEKFWLKTPYIEYDYIFNLLQYAFYAIVLLNQTAYRRFYAAYTVWQNIYNMETGGICENQYILDKLTYFGKNNIFYIKPSSGQIYKLEVASFKGLKGKTISDFTTIENCGCSYLCAELTDGSLVKLFNRTTKNFCGALTKQGIVRKKSEDGMGWLSFCLGEDIDPTTQKQSAFHILNHTLVALSLYGLDVMKYGRKYIRSHPMYALPSKWTTEGEERSARTKEKNNYIQPLFAYLGNKHKLLPDIQKLFPKDIDIFIDLFGGSGVVGINSDAKQVLINDSNLFLIGIYKGIQETAPDAAWDLIETVISQYSLNKENENGYYACRDEYNNVPYEKRCIEFWYWGLVLVWCSFNRSTVQFNLQNEYNAPFGFNKVNFDLAKQKFFAFAKKVSGSKIVFTCDDYKSVNIQAGAFVYIDPPYLITTATYNKGWDEQAESELYSYLETLDNKGVKWAMSNVFENNGNKHPTLPEWVRNKGYNIHHLESEYIHANFRRKNKGKTIEVLVTNY